MPRLHITTENRHDQTCYKLSGSLDLGTRPLLAEIIECRWKTEKVLILDLSEVREIDLSGLSWLLRAETVMRERKGQLRIVAASPAVQRAMQLLNPATRTLFGDKRLRKVSQDPHAPPTRRPPGFDSRRVAPSIPHTGRGR